MRPRYFDWAQHPEKDAELRRLIEGGTSPNAVAAAMGMTYGQITNRITVLGLTGPQRLRALRGIASDAGLADDEIATVIRMRTDGATMAGIARELGRSFGAIERTVERLERAPSPPSRAVTTEPKTSREWGEQDGGNAATLKATVHEPVRTLEDLVTVCAIDTTTWDVVEWTANTWETAAKDASGAMLPRTLYQVKARLRKRITHTEAITKGILDALKRRVKPLRPRVRPVSESGYLFVATMGEPHLGKMAWAPETGESYDLHIGMNRIRASHRHLMQRASVLAPERIALIIGDDFFTADNPGNTTTAGTPQEVDGRYRKVFRAGVALCREIIEGWRAIAPVEVWVKVGNHDQTITWHAGEVLATAYHASDDVTIINPDRLRYYRQWGTCLIGLTHGDKEKDEKLPLLMAAEAPMWSDTRCRVWLCGHFHTGKAKTQRTIVRPMESDANEEMGVMVRRIRSLSGTDAWHFGLAYVQNIKAAEGFVYHKTMGETDMHTAMVWEDVA